MEVFDINGQIISPLAGKTLYVAGDSIAYGKGSAGGKAKISTAWSNGPHGQTSTA